MLYNEKQAMREGWLLSSRDDGFYEIQKYDDMVHWRYDHRFQQLEPPFKTDDEALAYVKSVQFSLMHAEAAALHGKRWRP